MFEHFNEPVDIYCERLSTDFWAEPLNALTNLAFILAAILVIPLLRNRPGKTWDIKLLAGLTMLVGIGSFLFHTLATKGTSWADILPIIIFIHFAIWVIFVRVFRLTWYYAIVGVIVFMGFNALVLNILGRELFNGSISYVPTLLLLLAVAFYTLIKRKDIAGEFTIAALVFLISITCRSIDMMMCPTLSIGTHFLWHILNGVVMYYVMKGLVKTSRLF